MNQYRTKLSSIWTWKIEATLLAILLISFSVILYKLGYTNEIGAVMSPLTGLLGYALIELKLANKSPMLED